jgi:hypothetical protein
MNISTFSNAVIIMYGSFRICPKPFYQLHTFHGMLFGRSFPIIFVLMEDKSQKTYENILKCIKEKFVICVNNFIVDFEIAATNALERIS